MAALQYARQLVQAGELGPAKNFEASYLQSWLVFHAWGAWRTEPKWLWRLSKNHGSNRVLGDIGGHILDFAAYVAGSGFSRLFCRLGTFPKAEGDRVGEYDLDANDSFAMTARLENGALAVVHATRWATGHINELRLRIYGALRAAEVVYSRPESSQLRICLGADAETGTWTIVDVRRCPPITCALPRPCAERPISSPASGTQPISKGC